MNDLDSDVLACASALVYEEHRLHGGDGGDPARLREVEEELDGCWDLLRQRRARREYGEDPDGAEVRSTSTVKNYRQ